MFREHFSLLWYLAAIKFRLEPSDAEDVIQDSMMSYAMSFTRIDNPRAWLVAAVCNAARRCLRQRAKQRALLVSLPRSVEDDADPEAGEVTFLDRRVTPQRIEAELLVREVLRQMSARHRAVLRLHYFLGMTEPEIAAHYRTTSRYARKLITNALRKARKVINRIHSGRDGGHP